MDQAAREARSRTPGAGDFGQGPADIAPGKKNQQGTQPGPAPRPGSPLPSHLGNPAGAICLTKPEACIATSLIPVAALLVIPAAVVGTTWWATSDDGDQGDSESTPEEQAHTIANELVKQAKAAANKAGRSGDSAGAAAKVAAGSELIRRANKEPKGPLRDAPKKLGNQLIKKGKANRHPGGRR
jgi:hypothetical protein